MNRPTHVATKVFQSLRIFVNNELNELSNGISIIHRYLRPGGRLAVITFHSLEDRIVKSHFNDVSLEDTLSESESDVEKKRKKKFQMNKNMDLTNFSSYVRNLWTPLNKKVLVPSGEEIAKNPRSRSAKLRVAIKN